MTPSTSFAVSADGTQIHAADYGRGRPIVIVHGGLGAAEHWSGPADILAGTYRIIAIERRVYGRSGPPQSPHSMAREADDVAAVLGRIGEPALVVGHSSGAVVTLEAALLHPPELAGLVLYEPPVSLDVPIGADSQQRSEAALAAGDADTALRIFFAEMVGLPPQIVDHMSRSPEFAGGWGEMKRLAPNQMEDNRGIRALPLGVARYAAIDVPALLLKGAESPRHLHARLDALQAVMPRTSTAIIIGDDHTANLTSPGKVAEIISAFALSVFA